MKKQLYMVVTIIALVSVAGLSSAKAQTRLLLKADIPFAFSVGSKTLPAGEYILSRMSSDSSIEVLQLRSRDGHESALVRTNSVSGQIQDHGKLIFARYGDQYFFAQAWVPANSIGMQSPRSQAEKRIERELAARNQTKETVAVNAKR